MSLGLLYIIFEPGPTIVSTIPNHHQSKFYVNTVQLSYVYHCVFISTDDSKTELVDRPFTTINDWTYCYSLLDQTHFRHKTGTIQILRIISGYSL